MRISNKLLIISALTLLPWQALAADTKPAAAATAATSQPAKAKRLGGADINGDGIVSNQEFIANAQTRFKRMDANADGNVTRDEMKAFREKVKASKAAKPAAKPKAAK